MLTELQAVNRMLAALPLAQVSSLTSPKNPATVEAITTLSESRRWFLLFGWEFNREEQIELTPNGSNEIALPATYMSVRYRDDHRTIKKIVQRGAKLYNATDHTYTFTDPVKVDVLVDIDFEDMPDAAQEAVVAEAALRLKRKLAPDSQSLQALYLHAQQAMTNARIAEQRSGKFHVADDLLSASTILRPQRRRGPFL